MCTLLIRVLCYLTNYGLWLFDKLHFRVTLLVMVYGYLTDSGWGILDWLGFNGYLTNKGLWLLDLLGFIGYLIDYLTNYGFRGIWQIRVEEYLTDWDLTV